MQNLETNLREAAREAFRMYPEIYHVDQPTDEKQIEALAHAYGIDGFFESGMSWEDVRAAVFAEWNQWVNDCKEEQE
ncbi:MAG: hypothetical protein IPN33_25685 [Saprospiraceae bacterium]|nr:hypothetical protein [Saprospiraceae bacterium]